MADNLLDSIPVTAVQSPLLLISRPIIPYDDLNIKGDRPTYLKLFGDVGFNLSMMMGMSEQGPKMVSVTPDNALRVASVGSGITGLFVHESILSTGFATDIRAPTVRHVWMISVDAQGSIPFPNGAFAQFDMPDESLSQQFSVGDGERWIFDILAHGVFITNTSGGDVYFRIWGFDFTNVQESLVVAT